jgi:hypothetical protein
VLQCRIGFSLEIGPRGLSPERERSMSWESEQVAGFRERKQQTQQRDSDAVEKLRFLNVQAPRRWAELRESLIARCRSLSREAASEKFLAVSDDSFLNLISVVREDYARLECRYDQLTYTARFTSPECTVCNKAVKVEAKIIDGAMQVVWTADGGVTDTDRIVVWVLDTFLKF